MNSSTYKFYQNPDLVTLCDNKARWNLPEFRRMSFRNLHRINRYGIFLRSDLVLALENQQDLAIQQIPLVKKMLEHNSFCSLVVVKDQSILFEQYADDFPDTQPHSIQSISKMFLNLFIGELVENGLLDLEKTISEYLPDIGSGYANASLQSVLNMDIQNQYSEDYLDPFSSSYLQETAIGWRLPSENSTEQTNKEFLNNVKAIDGVGLENNTGQALYKSSNSDVLSLLLEKVSDQSLREWLLSAVEAAGFEDGLHMGTDRTGMPTLSGGGSLIARDLARLGLLFARRGEGVNNRRSGSTSFIDKTLTNPGPKYMKLKRGPPSEDDFVRYSNQIMVGKNWIGHGGYGGQYLLINMLTGVVAAFYSVLETPSATDVEFKTNIVLMLEEISNQTYQNE
jgi:CubicO group peptidase (beta-lactamase class C family)